MFGLNPVSEGGGRSELRQGERSNGTKGGTGTMDKSWLGF
jgi:hypothetical protein